MPKSVADKLSAVIAQIDECGNADLLRLTVLKKWFERPGRLAAFALWVASRAVVHGSGLGEPASALFREVHELLWHREIGGGLDRRAAERLYHRLRSFQSTYQRGKWGPVRIVTNAKLLLIEEALALYLWHGNTPSLGYKLAAAYAEHYDPRYGNGLNGPSRGRLEDLIDFVRYQEAIEAQTAEGARPLTRVP